LLLALLTACSGAPSGNDGGDEGLAPLSPVELCDRLASARCELMARCYPAFSRQEPSQCRSLELARCLGETDRLRPSFEERTLEVDTARVLACEERMKSSSCVPSFPPGYAGAAVRPYADCELNTGLLRGKTPAGQTCSEEAECAEGSRCVKLGGVCKGTCVAFPQAGEPCAFGCAPGLYCDGDDRCAKPKGLHAACSQSAECEADLYCQTTCRRRGQAGEACVFDPQRLSTCEPGLACDVTPYLAGAVGTCVKPKEKGAPCRFHFACAVGLVCFDLDFTGFPDRMPAEGFCHPVAALDTNCPFTPYAVFLGDQCEPGTQCSAQSRKCAFQPSLGEACTPSSQSCAGLDVYCKPSGSGDLGTCSKPPQVGERCAFALDATRRVSIPCASGFCDTQSTLSCWAPNKQLGQPCTVDGECLSNRCAVQQDSSRRCTEGCS
jgi:hypothetical protein